MLPARIIAEDWAVEARLAELFGVSRAELESVARAAVGARRDSVDDDPINAPGTLSYIFGTRALRQLFRGKGWRKHRADGVEAVFSPERRLKVVFQNADWAADEHREPRAVSDKGSASERAVRLGQGWLFPEMAAAEAADAGSSVWYLLVSVNGEDVCVEISYPRAIENSQFFGFHERIFILKKGDMRGFALDIAGDPPPDFDFEVTRK